MQASGGACMSARGPALVATFTSEADRGLAISYTVIIVGIALFIGATLG